MTMAEVGAELHDLVEELSEWSQATFGSDDERGPLGPLRHLQLEAKEAEEAVGDKAALLEELADCLMLVLDASRRSGVKVMALLGATRAKIEKNRRSEWPRPGGVDEPVFRIRRQGETT